MTAANTERNAEIMAWVARGRTQRTIAAHFGLDQSTVSEIIQRERNRSPIDKQDAIATQVEILDQLIEEMRELAEMKGAPVTAGKDGDVVRDPDDQSVVRDYGLRVNATAQLKSLLERKSKLLGLDSPTRTELSGGVTYEIRGVNVNEIE